MGEGVDCRTTFHGGHTTTRDMGLNLWGSVPCSSVGSSPQEVEVVPGNRIKCPLGIPPGYWDVIFFFNSISESIVNSGCEQTCFSIVNNFLIC